MTPPGTPPGPPQTGGALRGRAERLAGALPPLLVAAERVAATVAQGVHGRRRVGQGETFWQYRHYEPGDPPQLIDWRESAKSDLVYVRELEWEAAQSVWIWRDTSASMAWRSSDNLETKRMRADLLTLALIALLVRGGEHVTLLGSGYGPASGRQTLERLALFMDRDEGGGEGVPGFRFLPRHAHLVLLGDFLSPLEEIDASLRRFAEHGLSGHVVQILDPAEESLPFSGRVRFDGLEGEEPWLVSRVEGVRDDYVARLARQREGLAAIASRIGWTFASHRSDTSPEAALIRLYAAMSQAVVS